jgi:anthranilate phosphoribosyltransferase
MGAELLTERHAAQIAGVFAAHATGLVAGALAELGVERAFVVHGADGLDEISISSETCVAEVRGTAVRTYTVTPEEFGVKRAPLEEIAGGDATENAAMVLAVLAGKRDARRDIVVINASAALVAAGRAEDFREGARQAEESIDSGAARKKLEQVIAFVEQHK